MRSDCLTDCGVKEREARREENAPAPTVFKLKRSVHEILDAYEERLYKLNKEKYVNGIPTR